MRQDVSEKHNDQKVRVGVCICVHTQRLEDSLRMFSDGSVGCWSAPSCSMRKFSEGLPPLLRLIPQAVSSSDFKELVGVQTFLDVRLRHGHMERSLWPFLPVSQQER